MPKAGCQRPLIFELICRVTGGPFYQNASLIALMPSSLNAKSSALNDALNVGIWAARLQSDDHALFGPIAPKPAMRAVKGRDDTAFLTD